MDLKKDIHMIKKTLAIVIFATTLSFSSFSFAADLEHNMEILGKNFKAFNTTDNQKDALKALGNMKSAALDAKKVKLKTKDAKAPTSDALFVSLLTTLATRLSGRRLSSTVPGFAFSSRACCLFCFSFLAKDNLDVLEASTFLALETGFALFELLFFVAIS